MEQNKDQQETKTLQDMWPAKAPVIKTVSGYEYEDFTLLEELRRQWIERRAHDYAQKVSLRNGKIDGVKYDGRYAGFADGAREMYSLMMKIMEVPNGTE